MEYTTEKVKSELPSVKLRFNGRVYTGYIRDQSDHARIWVPTLDRHFDYAWISVVNALNSGRELRA